MKRVWLLLASGFHALATAVGFRAVVCGHWGGELADGLCFDCAVKRIERDNWRMIGQVMADTIAAHPELLKSRGKQEAKP